MISSLPPPSQLSSLTSHRLPHPSFLLPPGLQGLPPSSLFALILSQTMSFVLAAVPHMLTFHAC
eukprot:3068759-Rhodomonas_salina.1